jgi:hypothetical protein
MLENLKKAIEKYQHRKDNFTQAELLEDIFSRYDPLIGNFVVSEGLKEEILEVFNKGQNVA